MRQEPIRANGGPAEPVIGPATSGRTRWRHPRYISARSGGRGRELQRHAIHAVAQAGRLGSILEDVAEMAAAAVARNSRSRHAEGVVLRFIGGVLEGGPKARPSGAAFEFGLRRIERQVAAGAGERSGAVF